MGKFEADPRFLAAVAKTIKQVRTEKKWSHDELAERAGVDRSYISHLEAEKRAPSVPVLQKIAHAAGWKMSEFFTVVEAYMMDLRLTHVDREGA